ncbi:MYB transcription factor [Salix suchowensis]|nr:MYB transcription factor [Salix suchowensis]
MDRRRKRQAKTASYCYEQDTSLLHVCSDLAEVSSIEWEFINMSEQEEDLIYRMHKLVGTGKETTWALIAGRIPGRKAEEIERFWLMRHGEGFVSRRKSKSDVFPGAF